MTLRKTSRSEGSKPKRQVETDVCPGLVISPVLSKKIDDKRAAAREAVARLAKMTPEEQVAALFHSLGTHKKV